MMTRYKQLLLYIKSAVTRNYSEKSINSILDYISTSKQVRNSNSGLILWMRPTHERLRHNVASSLIGWAHTQNDPWGCLQTIVVDNVVGSKPVLGLYRSLFYQFHYFVYFCPLPLSMSTCVVTWFPQTLKSAWIWMLSWKVLDFF